MRISAMTISATLLVGAAGTAFAADQRYWDGNGVSSYTQGIAADSTATLNGNFIEKVRLDAKDLAAGQRNRGTKDQAKSELNQIIVYYDAAIKHDPKDDDAYFHRGLASFYAGAVPQALADLAQAGKLDPQYPYYPLWIDIIDKRGNQKSRLPEAISHIDMTKWPAPVVRLFLGELTPSDLLAAADNPDAATKKGQVCEANFYIGELALQQDGKDEAARLFRLAAAYCPPGFVEGPSARSELEALGVTQ